MATIFGDYVAGFLGLGRDGSTWSMNPFDVSWILMSIYITLMYPFLAHN